MDEIPTVKLVAVGYTSEGKTSMFITYTSHDFPTGYIPTVFDSYAEYKQTTHGQTVLLQLWDICEGRDANTRFRPLAYPNTDVLLLCYAVDTQHIEDMKSLWYHELQRHCEDVPLILVATRTDLRDNVNVTNAFTTQQGKKMAEEINAMYYMEISSLRGEGLDELFQRAIDIGHAHSMKDSGLKQ